MSFGFNFGSSKQKSSQQVWGPQADALKGLYGNVSDYYQANNPYLNAGLTAGASSIPGITGYTDQALPAWSNFLAGGSFSGFNPNIGAVNDMAAGQGAGFNTYQNLMGDVSQNPYLAGMAQMGLNQLGSNYERFTKNNTDLQAAFGGGYGQAGWGKATGNDLFGLNQAGGNFLQGLYGNAFAQNQATQLAAAQGYNADQLAAIQAAGAFGTQADQTGINALNAGAAATNLGFAAPNLYNQLYGMQWSPYLNAASVFGNPTTLSQSKGSSMQFGFSPSSGGTTQNFYYPGG